MKKFFLFLSAIVSVGVLLGNLQAAMRQGVYDQDTQDLCDYMRQHPNESRSFIVDVLKREHMKKRVNHRPFSGPVDQFPLKNYECVAALCREEWADEYELYRPSVRIHAAFHMAKLLAKRGFYPVTPLSPPRLGTLENYRDEVLQTLTEVVEFPEATPSQKYHAYLWRAVVQMDGYKNGIWGHAAGDLNAAWAFLNAAQELKENYNLSKTVYLWKSLLLSENGLRPLDVPEGEDSETYHKAEAMRLLNLYRGITPRAPAEGPDGLAAVVAALVPLPVDEAPILRASVSHLDYKNETDSKELETRARIALQEWDVPQQEGEVPPPVVGLGAPPAPPPPPAGGNLPQDGGNNSGNEEDALGMPPASPLSFVGGDNVLDGGEVGGIDGGLGIAMPLQLPEPMAQEGEILPAEEEMGDEEAVWPQPMQAEGNASGVEEGHSFLLSGLGGNATLTDDLQPMDDSEDERPVAPQKRKKKIIDSDDEEEMSYGEASKDSTQKAKRIRRPSSLFEPMRNFLRSYKDQHPGEMLDVNTALDLVIENSGVTHITDSMRGDQTLKTRIRAVLRDELGIFRVSIQTHITEDIQACLREAFVTNPRLSYEEAMSLLEERALVDEGRKDRKFIGALSNWLKKNRPQEDEKPQREYLKEEIKTLLQTWKQNHPGKSLKIQEVLTLLRTTIGQDGIPLVTPAEAKDGKFETRLKAYVQRLDIFQPEKRLQKRLTEEMKAFLKSRKFHNAAEAMRQLEANGLLPEGMDEEDEGAVESSLRQFLKSHELLR